MTIYSRNPFERGWNAFSNSLEIRTRDFRHSPARWVGEQMNQLPGGFFAAGMLTTINPIGGVIFGVTEMVTRLLVSRQSYPIDPQDHAARKFTKIVVPLIVSIGAGLAALALAGFTLTEAIVVPLVVGTVAYTALLTLTLFAAGIIYHGAHATWDGMQAFCNC